MIREIEILKKEYRTFTRVSEVLGITYRTLYNIRKAGVLPESPTGKLIKVMADLLEPDNAELSL